MLLVRVAAEEALPFKVKIPNATTVKPMRAADKGKGKRSRSAGALFKELGTRSLSNVRLLGGLGPATEAIAGRGRGCGYGRRAPVRSPGAVG